MLTPLLEQNARALIHKRQLQAEAENRARLVRTVRRLERKADKVNRQVRLARLALG